MKKITLAIFTFIIATSLLTSCSNEEIDPALNTDPEVQCIAPNYFQVSDFIDGTNVNLTWVPGANETSWEIEYGLSGFSLGSGTLVASTTHNITIAGLTSTNSYQFYLRSKCSTTDFSSYVGPIAINSSTNDSCLMPTNLSAVRFASNLSQINLNWTAIGEATSWEIQYGPQGFVPGNGNSTLTTTNSFQFTGMSLMSAYDFYVRAVCSATENSNWTPVVTVPAVTSPPITNYAFMGANVYNVQRNGLRPLLYGFTQGTSIDYFDSSEAPYLKMQGNSNYQNPTITPGTFEINIRIPQSQWHPGTYALQGDIDVIRDGNNSYVHFIQFPAGFVVSGATISNGTITVTEFNTTTRRITGTFSFDYISLYNDGTSSSLGHVTNGTFDYPLDDDFFD